MSMTGGIPYVKMSGFSSSFQYKENNSMIAEILKGNALASAEEAYGNPG